jgi:eukaryotic-like serine/threonine-protein kinase
VFSLICADTEWFIAGNTCTVSYMTVDPSAPPAGVEGSTSPAARNVIGQYLLERVVGSGGMGVVWAGNDQEQQRPYAIKLLRSGGDTAQRKQLLERARAAIALRHPNVLPVREVGSDGNRDFVAMELVEGQCVADWLASQPPQREVLEVMQQAGRALEAAHRAGVIHRNFKLHNVLRAREGEHAVRVADFGLARGQLLGSGERALSAQGVAAGNDLGGERPPPRNQDAVLDAALTQNGVYVGTPASMALELWRGMSPDERSDQFAFCVAVWEALTGTRPFTGETLAALETSVAAGVPASAGSSLPPGVRAALMRGLDPEAIRRWPSMGALLAALEQVGPVAAPRARTLMTAAAGAVAVGSLLTIFLLLRGGDSGEPVALPVEADPAPRGALAAVGNEDEACAPAAEAFGEVWTADRRAKLEAQRGSDQEVAQALDQLDDVRARWTEAYSQACARKDPSDSQRSRACLMLARDRAGVVVAQLESAGDVAEVAGLVPAISACQ